MGVLNDIVGLYRISSNEKQKDIVNKFIKHLWNSKCSYAKITKKVKFDIDDRIVDEALFDTLCKYNDLSYKKIKSKYNSSSMNSFDYIRVHINNLYAYLFDNEVYVSKEYINNLYQPRNIYFEYIKGEISKDDVINKLKEFDLSDTIQRKKYNLSMNEYKKIINNYIIKIFNNIKTSEEYIDENGFENRVTKDDFDYDNLLISYFNNCLTGYLRNYIKNLDKPKYKFCNVCGILIEEPKRNQQFCFLCKSIRKKEQWKKASNKYYHT